MTPEEADREDARRKERIELLNRVLIAEGRVQVLERTLRSIRRLTFPRWATHASLVVPATAFEAFEGRLRDAAETLLMIRADIDSVVPKSRKAARERSR